LTDELSNVDPANIELLREVVQEEGVNPDSAEGQAMMIELAGQWGLTGEEEEPIGYTGPRKSHIPGGPGYFGPEGSDTNYYMAGDEFNELSDMNTETLRRWQEKMITLGLLDGKNTILGVRDMQTITAMSDLLGMSNAEGVGWGVMLQQLEGMAGEDGALFDADDRKFTAPAYLSPDYATLAQEVKKKMRDALGRDPDDAELAVLVGELQGYDRAGYEAEVAASKAEFEASQAGAAATPGSFTNVDPLARFNEFFEKKYASEIDFVEERDERTPLSQEVVQGGVSTLSQMSRDA
jgi:hypothetical protein